MAAFNPTPLLVPAASLLARASGAAAKDQALKARQALDAEVRQQAAAARAADARAGLSEALAARAAALDSDTARQRARFATSGVSGGASRQAVLDGLQRGAAADADSLRAETHRRLEAIRRGVEVERRRDLLELAEARRRSGLARRSAAYRQDLDLTSPDLPASAQVSHGSLFEALGGLGGLGGFGGQLGRRWF